MYEEKRRDISVDMPSTEQMALVSRSVGERGNLGSQKRYYCTFCKMYGHSLDRHFKANKDKPTCTHCKMSGHSIDTCYKVHGYPPGHRLHGRTQANVIFCKL